MRSGIEPWLTSLFQSEHLSLLIGTGPSYSLSKLVTTSDVDAKTGARILETSGQTLADNKETFNGHTRTYFKKIQGICSIFCEGYASGHFLCIPDWEVGCEIADLSDVIWNSERLTKHLKKADAASVVFALTAAKEHLEI